MAKPRNEDTDHAPSGESAVQGASLLVLLQILSRAVTFLANQAVLRFLTPQILGVSAQLEVYYLSVLFFARESLRVALQRHRSGPSSHTQISAGGQKASAADVNDQRATARNSQEVVNLSFISIGLGLIVAVVFGWMYLSTLAQTTLSSTPHIIGAVYVYGAAAVIELLSEPAFVLLQIRLQFRTRAIAESLGTLFRCVATLGVAVWASRQSLNIGVVPFATGQFCYGLTLLAIYGWAGAGMALRETFWLVPRKLDCSATTRSETVKSDSTSYVWGYFYRPTLSLASSMMAQSVVKHVLTQGDTLLVSILSTPTEQGVYALANNYGGLIARLVFQPVEETSRSYFSRLFSRDDGSPSSSSAASPPRQDQQTSHDESGPKAPSAGKAAQPKPISPTAEKASTDLFTLLKTYTFLALPLTAIGPTAAPLVLSLIAGPRWASSGAGRCLSAYVWYIPFMALNGVLEAFVASVATEAQVHVQSLWMGLFSLGFAATGVVFLRVLGLGAVGLVIANSVNMACRIIWCLWFTRSFFRRLGVEMNFRALLPKPLAFLITAAGAHVAGKFTAPDLISGTVLDKLFALARIAGVAVPLLLLLCVVERRLIISVYQLVRPAKGKPAAWVSPRAKVE